MKTRSELAALALLALSIHSSPTPAMALAPQLSGSFAAGSGANAEFVKLDNSWQQSSVLYDDVTSTYGQGKAISTYAWGSGLWGIADAKTILGLPRDQAPILGAWSGVASQIDFANDCYSNLWSDTWGPASLPPLFAGPRNTSTCTGNPQDDGDPAQNNYVGYFTGYLRITTPGTYSFGVLNDDGFWLNLFGADGQKASAYRDFLNPRAIGTLGGLDLSPGLYGFELGSYNRLQAGVVRLLWNTGGAECSEQQPQNCSVVPQENLVRSVPEPGTLLLLATGLMGMLALRSRRTGRLRRAAALRGE